MKYDDKDLKPKKDSIYDQFYDFSSVMSNTEMTGLTPSMPPSEDDVYSYAELMGMPIKEYKTEVKKKKENERVQA